MDLRARRRRGHGGRTLRRSRRYGGDGTDTDTGVAATETDVDAVDYSCDHSCLTYSECYGRGTFVFGAYQKETVSCPDGKFCCDLDRPPSLCERACVGFYDCPYGKIDLDSYCEGSGALICCNISAARDTEADSDRVPDSGPDAAVDRDTDSGSECDGGPIGPCPNAGDLYCLPRAFCARSGAPRGAYYCGESTDVCCAVPII